MPLGHDILRHHTQYRRRQANAGQEKARVRVGSKPEVAGLLAQVRSTPQEQTSSGCPGMSERCHVWTAPGWQELSLPGLKSDIAPCPFGAKLRHRAYRSLTRKSRPEAALKFTRDECTRRYKAPCIAHHFPGGV